MNSAARLAFASLAIAAALSAAPALAQTKVVSAPAGKTVWVDTYMGWKDNCSPQLVNIDIVSPPKHGTVTPKPKNEVIRHARIGQASTCNGRTVKGLGVYYKSKSGYRGADSFAVRISVGGQPASFSYVVNVR